MPDDSYRFYLTDLPAEVGPHQAADIYRVRWEIESDNKLDKSCNHIDAVRAQTAPAARALVHASLISSMLACLVAHRHRLKEARPRRAGQERTRPPNHPQSLARAMGVAAPKIAAALALGADRAREHGRRSPNTFSIWARPPNWRRNPLILDQMRGWKVAPGRPRRSKLASPTTRSAR